MGTIVEISKKNFPIKEIPIVFKDRFRENQKYKLEIFRTLKIFLL